MSALDHDTTQAAERLVIREAALLDDGCWDEWRALFTADGTYWMPLDPAQPDARLHVSLLFDDAMLMDLRCRRLAAAADDLSSLSLQPLPRVLRFLSNIDVTADGADGVAVRANLLAAQHAAGVTRTFHARVRWALVRDGAALRIRQKRVDLLGSGDALPDILVYL
jgi:3-phenylpropionate/cinnamic acid dioxygenase small subunit